MIEGKNVYDREGEGGEKESSKKKKKKVREKKKSEKGCTHSRA